MIPGTLPASPVTLVKTIILNAGTTGVGVVSLDSAKSMSVGNHQALLQRELNGNKKIVYYAGAAWDKAGKIKNAQEWFSYLQNFKDQLRSPLTITVP